MPSIRTLLDLEKRCSQRLYNIGEQRGHLRDPVSALRTARCGRVHTVIAHSYIRDNLLQDGLPLGKLLVL